MTEQSPEPTEAAQSEYSPEEIAEASAEENSYTQQVLLQQLQQRNVALNIEVRRAQKRQAESEKQNEVLRSVIRNFEDNRPVEKTDTDAVDPVVEKYLAQARTQEDDGKSGVHVV